jgi:hypothetical protein
MRSTKTKAQNRVCGACSLCCKLVAFFEINKPMGQWCPHCTKSNGCSIYDTRPNECRSFNCGWLINPEFGDEWQPIRSKIVIRHVRDGDMSILVFHVDAGSPLTWREEPYYSQLKRLARSGLEHNGWVNIFVGKRLIVILPNKDVDCGMWEPSDKISYQMNWNGFDWEVEVHKVPQEAPTS